MTARRIKVGRLLAPYGVKGWVKVYSYTDPMNQIFAYQPWYIVKERSRAEPREVKLLSGEPQGKGLIARFEGINDRDEAASLGGYDIWVDEALLPELESGEYYWHQLESLVVYNEAGVRFGTVDHMLETGANDVLVVKPDSSSIDDRERLIPWVEETYVLDVDLAEGKILVAWDPEY